MLKSILKPTPVLDAHAQKLEIAVETGNLIDVINLIKKFGLGSTEADHLRGSHLLIKALKGGHSYVAKFLLFSNVKADCHKHRSTYEDIPLHLACSLGYKDIAKMCIDNGAKIEELDNLKRTPLYYCRHADIAQMLLERGASIDHKDKHGRTPLDELLNNLHRYNSPFKHVQLFIDYCTPPTTHTLHELIRNGLLDYPEVLRLTPDIGIDMHERNDNGYTAFLSAVRQNNIDHVRVLLDHGSDMYARSQTKFKTALHMAASSGYVDIIELLLNRGFRIDSVDEDGNTALHLACRENKVEAAAMLLNHGINPNLGNKKGETSLHVAVRGRIINIVKLLLYGKDITQLESKSSPPPVSHEIEVVHSMNENGLNINATDSIGRTPLHYAVERQSSTCFIMLMDHNANINATDEKGKSPFYLAIETYAIDIVKLMIGVGADVTAQFPDGTTPLHLAAKCSPIQKHKTTICDLLIDEYKNRKFDIDLLDANGYTPLAISIRESPLYIIRNILRKGADLDKAYWLDAKSFAKCFDNRGESDKRSESYLVSKYSEFAIKLIAAKLPQGAELLARVNEIKENDRKSGDVAEKKEFIIINQGDVEFEEDCLKEIKLLKQCKLTGMESLYDFLIEDDIAMMNDLCDIMASNKEFKNNMILNDFPIYRSLIDAKIWKYSPEMRSHSYWRTSP